MIAAGIDVGSSATKAVLLQDGLMVAYHIAATGAESVGAATATMEAALAKAGVAWGDVGYTVATGYGRVLVPFAQETVTELSCHARGAAHLVPTARTILDMGGQDCKAIRCDEAGRLRKFVMNDKCAAGTGRFLELMAAVLGLPLDDIGAEALAAERAVKINSTCAVFAKSEVAQLMRRGEARAEVLAGLHQSIVNRTFNLVRRVGLEADFVMTGGIAKNIGMVRLLEAKAGMTARIPPEPQIVGALGAALFAQDRLHGKGSEGGSGQ